MPPAYIFLKKWGYYCTWREDTEGIYLGRLLHLISNIDLAELLKEAEHGKLQLLVPSLCQPRVREVHQLQHPGEGREKKSDVTAAGHRKSKGLLAHGGASRLCDFYFLHCFGAIADKTDNKTLSRVHSFFFDRNTI